MSWLARLKNQKGLDDHPTKTTKTENSVSVVSVGCLNGHTQKAEGGAATHDATQASEPNANPAAWRELAQAYNAHHLNCLTCISAGRGNQYGLRCGTGAALWRAYSQSGL